MGYDMTMNSDPFADDAQMPIDVPGRRQARSHHHPVGRNAIAACTAIILAFLGLLLLPTGHANTSALVSVNGRIYAVPANVSLSFVASEVLALARPGSQLDLTGDVMTIGTGGPVSSRVNGEPSAPSRPLVDGTVVQVAHGPNMLEAIYKKNESIPYKTTVQGEGPIVSLARPGKEGAKTLYLGRSSNKQAASILITPAVDAVIQKSPSSKPGMRLAALTFDDGPGKWTQQVLDALAAKHIPATFFMLGGNAVANKALLQKVRAAGHEVANHSWDHPILTKLTPDQVRSQISRTAAVIGKGHFLRPPYGIYDASVTAIANSMGYRLVLWTVDTLDWKYPNVDSILSLVKKETRPGAIILMHDGGGDRSQTVAAIPKIIDWLLENGYSLTTIQNLL